MEHLEALEQVNIRMDTSKEVPRSCQTSSTITMMTCFREEAAGVVPDFLLAEAPVEAAVAPTTSTKTAAEAVVAPMDGVVVTGEVDLEDPVSIR